MNFHFSKAGLDHQVSKAARIGRHCPSCNRVIERSAGCDSMTCGGHAHLRGNHPEGCGHHFNWQQARPYQPSLLESVHRPPGFSAIVSWLSSTKDFSSQEAVHSAGEALQGLSAEDRRYAFANAVACALLKNGRQEPNLAQSLLSNARLQTALGFADGHPGLVRVAAMLCDISEVAGSTSLAASLLVGRDEWESSVGTSGQKLRNAVVNLLVAVLGGALDLL